jgi:PmbA protein
MLNKIIDILNENKEVSGWLISDNNIESRELFFVKDELNMNRRKDVHHIELTVYKDFEENGTKFKGSASAKISPAMSMEEISDKINQLAYSASFVKNPYYDLVKPTDDKIKELTSDKDIFEALPKIVDAIYKNDSHDNGKVNSCEVFVVKTTKRILNSAGVDEAYSFNSGEIELVIDWMESGEEVEVIDILDFSSFNPKDIENKVNESFENARNRATAKPIYDLEGAPVVLTGESVKEFLSYYVSKANAVMVYKKYSNAKVGENLQGDNIEGDMVNVELLPEVTDSVSSKYIDDDGVKLYELSLIENGVLKTYYGDARHSQYLGIDITGNIPNVFVKGGKYEFNTLIDGRCLEIISFSDFQMDPMTGDFGGEIRLAKLHDGDEIIPLTGGAITGNISKVQGNMLLSKETHRINNYLVSKGLKIFNFNLSV